ncbi:hypothetical protein [Streptomyces sp. NPDC058683]|uniref:hypothetical protein n=1 Tax=Streptomyces sp. NPDC058683 TaxID=3346597 RepID=UPI0036600428
MDEGGFEREYRKRRRPPGSYFVLLGVVLLNALMQTGRFFGDDGDRDWWGPPFIMLLIAVTLARVLLEQ